MIVSIIGFPQKKLGHIQSTYLLIEQIYADRMNLKYLFLVPEGYYSDFIRQSFLYFC